MDAPPVIPAPRLSRPRRKAGSDATAGRQAFAVPALPAWARLPDAADAGLGRIAVAAGAALGALNGVVHADAFPRDAWTDRLSLDAGAAFCALTGRSETPERLRDIRHLTRPGEDGGPPGRLALGARLVIGPVSAAVAPDRLARLLPLLVERPGHVDGAALATGLAALADAAAHDPIAAGLAGLRLAERLLGPGGLILGLALADIAVAQALRWPLVVPLVAPAAAGLSRRGAQALLADDDAAAMRVARLLLAGALAAHHDARLLAEAAARLEAARGRLRARGADAVIAALWREDSLAASAALARQAAMSDRALRRLFARLQGLNAVRELTGRSEFRLYGL